MAQWSAVRLQPYWERPVLNELARAGFETYCPRILQYRRLPNGAKVQATPLLFPGYVFILIVQQWHVGRYTPGVIGLIMDGERPARVPNSVIGELRSREHNGLIMLPKKPRLAPGAEFQINDRLRIRDGPLRGLFGLFAGMAPHDRIMVLMQILGASRPVEFGIGDVSRA
jgi:transcriptional antiterminator RfaH